MYTQSNGAFRTYEAISWQISRGLLFGPPCIDGVRECIDLQRSFSSFTTSKMTVDVGGRYAHCSLWWSVHSVAATAWSDLDGHSSSPMLMLLSRSLYLASFLRYCRLFSVTATVSVVAVSYTTRQLSSTYFRTFRLFFSVSRLCASEKQLTVFASDVLHRPQWLQLVLRISVNVAWTLSAQSLIPWLRVK